MSLVVMKFGGTSVEDPAAIGRTAAIVAGRVALGKRPVVVVSALAKVTDQLLRAAAAASVGDRTGALAISSRLRCRHRDTACALIKEPKNSAALCNLIDQKFDALDEILRGLAAILELTPRISDLIVSYGERISSRIVTAAFCERGIDAAHVDARDVIITDSQFQKAIPQDTIIEKRAAEKLRPLVDQSKVPVMGGFIASNEAGITTTLGRGGSDFTGASDRRRISRRPIEIWTDVDGIMTCDPRVCPDALRVKVISFEEAAELAYFGAKVLHPATILPAVKKNIPVLVLNSRNPACEGTRIISLAPHCNSPFKSIAVKKKLSIIDVVASRMLMTHGYLKDIFTIFDKHQCPVDMVSTSEVSVSLTVDSNDKLPAIAADLQPVGRREIRRQEGAGLHGGRRHSRPERHGRAGLQRHPPHQRAHDLAGRQRNQHELHDRRGRRRRSRALAATPRSSRTPTRPSSMWKQEAVDSEQLTVNSAKWPGPQRAA